MCADGQCIVPEELLYHVDRGRQWWFLCDGVAHCVDATDERYGKLGFNIFKCIVSKS